MNDKERFKQIVLDYVDALDKYIDLFEELLKKVR